MKNGDQSASVIASFAGICESLNEYARSLREENVFARVRTGADIRDYRSGWRLEKYIEAELNPHEGQWAVWWLELGRSGDKWLVSSHVSISHTDEHFDLDDFTFDSSDGLESSLRSALENLKAALSDHVEFRHAVEQSKAAGK